MSAYKHRARYPSELEDRIFEEYLKKCREEPDGKNVKVQ